MDPSLFAFFVSTSSNFILLLQNREDSPKVETSSIEPKFPSLKISLKRTKITSPVCVFLTAEVRADKSSSRLRYLHYRSR